MYGLIAANSTLWAMQSAEPGIRATRSQIGTFDFRDRYRDIPFVNNAMQFRARSEEGAGDAR
jgi:hypothetical protein